MTPATWCQVFAAGSLVSSLVALVAAVRLELARRAYRRAEAELLKSAATLRDQSDLVGLAAPREWR